MKKFKVSHILTAAILLVIGMVGLVEALSGGTLEKFFTLGSTGNRTVKVAKGVQHSFSTAGKFQRVEFWADEGNMVLVGPTARPVKVAAIVLRRYSTTEKIPKYRVDSNYFVSTGRAFNVPPDVKGVAFTPLTSVWLRIFPY